MSADCGIRPTTATEIEWLQDYVRKANNAAANQRQAADQGNGKLGAGEDHSEEDEDEEGSEGIVPSTGASKRNSLTLNNGLKSPTLFHMDTDKTPTTNSLLSHAQAQGAHGTQHPAYHASIRRHNSLASGPARDPSLMHQRGHASASPPQGAAMQPAHNVRDLPGFPDIEEAVGSDSSSPHGLAARQVWQWFEEHLNLLLDCVRNFRFDQFEIHLRSFWTNLSGDYREVVHAPAVAGLMARADAMVYNVRMPIITFGCLCQI